MGETFTTDTAPRPSAQGPELLGTVDGPLTYRERLRRGIDAAAESSMSLLDVSAGIALAHDDLRLTRQAMQTLDEPYEGMLQRQATDPLSGELRSDIILDFRRDAQLAGFANIDAMPGDARVETARAAVMRYAAEITQEFSAAHPEWTAEEVEAAVHARVADTATILGLDAEQQDALMHAQLEYHELKAAKAEIQAELSELRAERNERVRGIGRTALRGVVAFAGRVKNLPNALSAQAVVAGMDMTDRIRSMNAESRKKTLWGTAAGVAIAGLAGYALFRSGRGVGGGSSYVLAGSDSALFPDHVGTNLPDHIGSVLPDHVGAPNGPSHVGSNEFIIPNHVGTDTLPSHVGSPAGSFPEHVGAAPLPDHVGSPNAQTLPDHLGSATPDHVGAASPPGHIGSVDGVLPDHIGGGGNGIANAKASSELFASSDSVEFWPTKIRVSEWNSKTLDGSLTGISRQMLVRSGVASPSNTQIGALVDALRPQAQPNGFLLKGQELDLEPAKSALRSLLRK